jgi:hypothetical protein
VTTAAKAAPRKRSWRRALVGSIAVVLLAAAVTRQYLIAVLVLIAALAVTVLMLRARWARYRSGGWIAARRRRRHQGWAGPADLLRARRAAARLTRRICPGAGLLVLGTSRRQPVAVCRENSVLYVGVPGAGKTGALACHAADAPGALFATSTKTGLLLDTLLYRRGGPVWVLNADGYGGIPSTLAWSPLEGCEDSVVAERRAGDLADAAPHDPSGKDAHWDALSADMLKFLLHAAALTPGADILTVRDWASDLEHAGLAVHILARRGEEDWGRQLLALITTSASDERYWSAISSGVRAALSWLDNPVMKQAARPAPGTGFSAREFARSSGSVYLIGRNRRHGSLAPYFAALGAEIFEQDKHYAMEQPSGRLPVPATFVLDEMPLTCPLPLHDMLAEAREPLVTFVLAAQTLAQLRAKFGSDDGDTIRSACPVEVFTGGEKRHEDLEAVSGVIGSTDTWHGSPDDLRSEPLMPPGALHRLRKGRAVILMPECRPVLASLPAIWKRPGHERATLADFPVALPVPQPALLPARREAIPMPPSPAAVTEPVPVPALTADEEAPSWPVPVSH